MVTLNEAALQFLLSSELGPVGIDLRRRAEHVTELAARNASGPILGIDTGDLDSSIRFQINHDAEGIFATVGSNARHRGFSYPAFWDQNGRPWLSEALREGWQ